jgi:hypothetical protein
VPCSNSLRSVYKSTWYSLHADWAVHSKLFPFVHYFKACSSKAHLHLVKMGLSALLCDSAPAEFDVGNGHTLGTVIGGAANLKW